MTISELSLLPDDKLRVMCAERCGWLNTHINRELSERHGGKFPHLVGISPVVQTLEHGKDASKDYNYWTIPNYPASLDAMADAEKTLTDEQRMVRTEYLIDICGVDRKHINAAEDTKWALRIVELSKLADASARQRCIAFLAATSS